MVAPKHEVGSRSYVTGRAFTVWPGCSGRELYLLCMPGLASALLASNKCETSSPGTERSRDCPA